MLQVNIELWKNGNERKNLLEENKTFRKKLEKLGDELDKGLERK